MKTIAITYTPVLTKAIAFFAVVTAIAIFCYGFFLLEAVAHAASLTDANRQIHTLTAQVSKLEEQYLLLTKDMTLERAQLLGFVAPATVSTVFADAVVPALSMRTN